MEPQTFETDLAGRKLKLEIGKYANQANGAVMVRYGDTSVLATAVASKEPKDTDFFPLTVNYEERLYAVGKIPGGFIKRELPARATKPFWLPGSLTAPFARCLMKGFAMKCKW